MAYPINGAVDPETLGCACRRTVCPPRCCAENSVEPSDLPAGAAQVSYRRRSVTGSGQSVQAAIAQTDVLSGVDTLIDQGQQSGYAMRVNALTGVLAQESIDGAATPAVFTPDRRWSPDAPGLKVLTDLLSTLGASQVIAGIGTDRSGEFRHGRGNADYPDSARAQELPADYLDRVRDRPGGHRQPAADPGHDEPAHRPALVLDPLDRALDSAGLDGFPG